MRELCYTLALCCVLVCFTQCAVRSHKSRNERFAACVRYHEPRYCIEDP